MIKRHLRSLLVLIMLIAVVVPLWVTPAEAAYENTYKNTGNMRDDIIGVALTQVGYKEGSNNYTKYGVWYGLSNSPWCGMFVSWCAKEAGIPTSVLKRTGIANPKNFGLSYKSGSSYTPKKGDLFFKKNFSHVGLVYYVDGAYFYTIEGNTSNTGSQGDRVAIRRRKISDFYFSSPNYSGSSKSENTGCTHKYVTKTESAHPHKQYKVCSKCNKKSYTGKNVAKDSCKTCIQANCEHKYSSWKKASDDKHSRSCTKCGKSQSKSHDWEEGKILTKPTCVDKGTQQMVCSDCGATDKKSIPATEKHDYGKLTYVDETKHQKVCKVCDHKKTYAHTAGKKWNNDVIYHWTSCVDCGGRLEQHEHTMPDGCLSACSTCGYTDEAGHKLSDEYYYNVDSHWQTCLRCEQKGQALPHRYISDCDTTCEDCGYVRSGAADHTDMILSDATGHWRVCNNCNRTTDILSHTLDRKSEEWEDQVCIQCQYVLRSSEEHEHALDICENDENAHWGQCNCGEQIAPEAHTWNIQTGTCSICNMAYVAPKEESTGFLAAILQNIFN